MEWYIWLVFAVVMSMATLFAVPAIRQQSRITLESLFTRIAGTDELLGSRTCNRCGNMWHFITPHVTPYTHSTGCYCLCESCWTELGTPDARLPFYRMLWNDWTKADPSLSSLGWYQIEMSVRHGY